jgi:arsenite methyltransferase
MTEEMLALALANAEKAGGRIGVSVVVADDDLTPGQRAERGDYVGCIAGALSFNEYRSSLQATGFTDIEITATHQVADGMHSAIAQAAKPTTDATSHQAELAETCCGVTACCSPTSTPPIHPPQSPRPRPRQAAAAGTEAPAAA